MPSSISMVSPAPMSEGPTLTGPSEPTMTELGPSEAGSSEAGPSGINYYTLYIMKFDSFVWIIPMIYL